MVKRALSGAVAVTFAGTAANATLFSFASDVADTRWTWTGDGASMTDGLDAENPLTLLIDDDNGVLPELEFDVEFVADFTIEHVSSDSVDGIVLHNYTVDGEFSFVDNSGTEPMTILSAVFSNGVLTAPGDESNWGTNAAVIASDLFTDVTYTSGLENPDYGLFLGESIGGDDFSFELTLLNTSGALPYDGEDPGVPISVDGDSLPSEMWFAEGSFSGAATFVPAPSAAGLLALAGLAGLRARRR